MTTGKLREHFLRRNRFAAVSLGDCKKDLRFLLRRKGDCAFLVSREDRHGTTLLQAHALKHDLSVYHFSGSYLHSAKNTPIRAR